MSINKTVNHPTARVLIAGGICDCIFKHSNNPGEKFHFIFKGKKEMVNHLHELSMDINTKKANARLEVKVLIGLDMETSSFTVDPHPGQQDLFISAIMDINPIITTINKGNRNPTPWVTLFTGTMAKNKVC